MNKKRLHIWDYTKEFPFVLGIVTSLSEHRFMWAVNKNLELGLKKIQVPASRKNSLISLPYVYSYETPYGRNFFRFVPVSFLQKSLPAKYKQLDFFLIVNGPLTASEKETLIRRVRQLKGVNAAFQPEPFPNAVRKVLA